MPKQIGWSNESNLLYQISQQITRLINVTGTNGGGSITGSGTANYITRWTSSSSLNNSVIYQSSTGNVGIGTTTPSRKLDVNGDINVAGLLVAGSDIYSSRILTNAILPNTLTYIPFYSTSPYGEIMRLDNSGSVLIGTTTTNGNKLRVAGTSEFISSSTAGQSLILGNVNFKWNFNTSIAPQILSLAYGSDNVLNIGYDAPANLINIFSAGNIDFQTNFFTIGGSSNNPIASARFNVESTIKGSIPLPKMTTAQIKAIASPVSGLMAYSINDFVPCFYDSNSSSWKKLSHTNL